MKFICFCYFDIAKFQQLDRAGMEDIGKNCRPHDAALRETGRVFAMGSLDMPDKGKVALPREGKPTVSDGPYNFGNQQIGAFFLFTAKDMTDAVEVATKHAAANYGEHLGFAIEVRECDLFELSRVPKDDE